MGRFTLGSVLLGLAWYGLARWIGDVLDPTRYQPTLTPMRSNQG